MTSVTKTPPSKNDYRIANMTQSGLKSQHANNPDSSRAVCHAKNTPEIFENANDSDVNTALHQPPQTRQPQQQQHVDKQQFTCMYTKQLTQRRKVWHDGRLIVSQGRAFLHAAHPAVGSCDPILDEIELSPPQCQAILHQREAQLQSEKHKIEIQGIWVSSIVPTSDVPSLHKPLVSCRMKKVIGTKFRKVTVGECIPPPPRYQQHQESWYKRSRPLQPGELQQRHYGLHQQTQNQRQSDVVSIPNVTALDTSNSRHDQRSIHESSTNSVQSGGLFGNFPPKSLSHPLQWPNQSYPNDVDTIGDPRHQTLSHVAQSRLVSSRASDPEPSGLVIEKENRSPFCTNAFNPNSFYGEEDDENGLHENSQSEVSDLYYWDETCQPQDQPDDARPTPLARPLDAIQASETQKAPLTTLELLQLFSAGNETSNDGIERLRALKANSRVTSSTDEAKPRFPFELPPASASSSDEDEME